MTINEAVEVFKKNQPYRMPVKYARIGNVWYIYSENTVNGGKHLPTLIENGYFSVDGNKVLPIIPLDIPRDINFLSVPYNLRAPYTPETK